MAEYSLVKRIENELNDEITKGDTRLRDRFVYPIILNQNGIKTSS